jgi:alkanesulfonate monooxygenase SsuD/methylene tetrahydromethanopterin reductase-like flavin-dependent oxidoreductase (luciferase family)
VEERGAGRSVTRLGLWLSDLARGPDVGLLQRASAAAEAAELAGFDSLWVSDQIANVGVGPGPDGTGYEAYSLLGALATRTRSIRLGTIPLGAEQRAPSIVAKIVTGIDVISHGRSELTLGCGSGGGESAAERLAERLQVCRTVLDDDVPAFPGNFYAVDGAVNRPRPLQVGGVPLVVFIDPAGPSQRATQSHGLADVLRVAARYADGVILSGDVSSGGEAVSVVESASVAHGRPPGSIQVIWTGAVSMESVQATDGGDSPRGAWPERVARLARRASEQLAAGADGCIVEIAGSDQLEAIAAIGAALRDVLGSAAS